METLESEIYLMDADGGNQGPPGGWHHFDSTRPSFDSTGSLIAFTRFIGAAEDSDICVVGKWGGPPFFRFQRPGRQDGARFSPDGKSGVAMSQESGPESGYSIMRGEREPDGSIAVTPLTTGGDYRWPVYSRDYSRIAYAKHGGVTADLGVMNADGTGKREFQWRLTEGRPVEPVFWSAEPHQDEWIGYIREDSHGASLWGVGADGRPEPMPILSVPNAKVTSADLSADGKLLYVAQTPGDEAQGSVGQIWLAKQVGEVVDGVPDYQWNYGCTPTVGGMTLGYWDNRPGYEDLIPGFEMPMFDGGGRDGDNTPAHDQAPANRTDASSMPFRQGLRQPQTFDNIVDLVIANADHVWDYWMGPSGRGGRGDPYKDAPSPWSPHPDNCLADYMRTSRDKAQWEFFRPDAPDGATPPWIAPAAEVAYLRFLHPNDRKYSFKSYLADFPSFGLVKDYIEQGCPAELHISLPGEMHSILAIGYYDGPGSDDWIAVHDTWQDELDNAPAPGVEAKMMVGYEWWKWGSWGGTQWLSAIAPPGKSVAGFVFLQDSFHNALGSLSGTGGYVLDSGTGAGTAEIVDSPLGDGNDVLRLSNPQADFVAIEREVSLAALIGISFQYLFDTEGKLKLSLDDEVIAELAAPYYGPGSAGGTAFAQFSQVFSMSELGLDPFEMHTLRIELSAPGDPVCYLDNLRVWNAIPEPATSVLLAGGLLVVLRRRKGR